MDEFMLFIKATGNPVGNLPPEKQAQHIHKVGGFIQTSIAQGNMKAAHPLVPSGVLLSNEGGSFTELPLNEKEEMIAGYYHIQATDLAAATEIAKSDPRFEDGTWTMEIRQIMKINGINN